MPNPPPKKTESADDFRERVRCLTFEQAAEQLEAIIDRIESGQVGLEDSLHEYERGMVLRDHCRDILARTEQRIVELTPPDAPKRGSTPD